jgi:hypothetical protein
LVMRVTRMHEWVQTRRSIGARAAPRFCFNRRSNSRSQAWRTKALPTDRGFGIVETRRRHAPPACFCLFVRLAKALDAQAFQRRGRLPAIIEVFALLGVTARMRGASRAGRFKSKRANILVWS